MLLEQSSRTLRCIYRRWFDACSSLCWGGHGVCINSAGV